MVSIGAKIYFMSERGLDQESWSRMVVVAPKPHQMHPAWGRTSIHILDKNLKRLVGAPAENVPICRWQLEIKRLGWRWWCPSVETGHGVGKAEMAGGRRWLKRGHDPNSPLSWPIIQPLIAPLLTLQLLTPSFVGQKIFRSFPQLLPKNHVIRIIRRSRSDVGPSKTPVTEKFC